jgi:hypothetical protein
MAYNNRATAIIENMINMINYNHLLLFRQFEDYRWHGHLAIDYDLARAATDHSPVLSTRLLSNSTVLQVVYFVS